MKSVQFFLRFSLRSCFLLWSRAFLLSVSPMVTPMALLSSINISRSLQLKFFSFFFYKEGARKYNFQNHENTRRTYLSVNLKCEVLIGGVSESGISLFSLQNIKIKFDRPWPLAYIIISTGRLFKSIIQVFILCQLLIFLLFLIFASITIHWSTISA